MGNQLLSEVATINLAQCRGLSYHEYDQLRVSNMLSLERNDTSRPRSRVWSGCTAAKFTGIARSGDFVGLEYQCQKLSRIEAGTFSFL